jgi:hypothetical protein
LNDYTKSADGFPRLKDKFFKSGPSVKQGKFATTLLSYGMHTLNTFSALVGRQLGTHVLPKEDVVIAFRIWFDYHIFPKIKEKMHLMHCYTYEEYLEEAADKKKAKRYL